MRQNNIKDMPVPELVDRFAEIALQQDKALFADDIKKFNLLYRQMDDVRNELQARSGDQRRALLKLFDHPNLQVRLKAAVTTLVVAPDAAREELRNISNSRRQPQAADAGMLLRGLDDGSFVPK
jgi:hypothetical protein